MVATLLSHLVELSRWFRSCFRNPQQLSITAPKKLLDYDGVNTYLAPAQSRTCLWVSADPQVGEEIGKVPGSNRSSRCVGLLTHRGHLEATTVRAFMVSAGCPKAGVTAEAHPHCRTCGRDSQPNQGRQSRSNRTLKGRSFIVASAFRCGAGFPTAGSQSSGRMPFVIRRKPDLFGRTR